jgi:hypothetical protein
MEDPTQYINRLRPKFINNFPQWPPDGRELILNHYSTSPEKQTEFEIRGLNWSGSQKAGGGSNIDNFLIFANIAYAAHDPLYATREFNRDYVVRKLRAMGIVDIDKILEGCGEIVRKLRSKKKDAQYKKIWLIDQRYTKEYVEESEWGLSDEPRRKAVIEYLEGLNIKCHIRTLSTIRKIGREERWTVEEIAKELNLQDDDLENLDDEEDDEYSIDPKYKNL